MMATESNYGTLLQSMQPRPIRSDRALAKAYKLIDQLMNKSRSAAESDMLELLSMLVEQYESREHPTPHVTPTEMLAHLIGESGKSYAALAREMKIPRSTLTEIMLGRRSISKANISRLASYFDVSPSVFLGD